MNLPVLVKVRQRLVGAMLRQEREKNGVALRTLSEQSGVPIPRLKAYELGERPVPVPELEALLALFGGQIEHLFDHTGPIGAWMAEQKTIQSFLELDPELQAFVSKPVNRPYLELALKLSNMSTEKLRSVAENLLDITY
jgi:transcriptional regulator with XRE-family HTH domain